jgi:PAS domain S-box-containing protein
MLRRRAFVFLLAALLIAGNLAIFWYLSHAITATLRDQASGADRALHLRLLLQLLVLGDLAVLVGLVVLLSIWGRRLTRMDQLRADYADARKALEMERQLAEVDQRVHLMFETAAAGVLLLSDDGRVLQANRRARALLGLERRGINGLSFADLLPSQARVRFPELRRVLDQEGAQTLTMPVRRADGEVFEAVAEFSPFEGPKNEEMISLFLRPVGPPLKILAEQTGLRRNKVLFADDEELIRLLAGNMLVRMGYQPLAAANGDQAVELFRAHHAELAAVVLDVFMPGQDGLAVAKHLREIDAEPPIVFCASLADGLDEETAEAAQPLIAKPFSFEELEKALSRHRR